MRVRNICRHDQYSVRASNTHFSLTKINISERIMIVYNHYQLRANVVKQLIKCPLKTNAFFFCCYEFECNALESVHLTLCERNSVVRIERKPSLSFFLFSRTTDDAYFTSKILSSLKNIVFIYLNSVFFLFKVRNHDNVLFTLLSLLRTFIKRTRKKCLNMSVCTQHRTINDNI